MRKPSFLRHVYTTLGSHTEDVIETETEIIIEIETLSSVYMNYDLVVAVVAAAIAAAVAGVEHTQIKDDGQADDKQIDE